MEIQDGRLIGARWLASAFCNERPPFERISLLVIHGISLPPGQFGASYIEDLFLGKLDANAHPYFQTIASAEVSAHCLIQRDGRVTQFVNFDQRAWHAGKSSFRGRENCNDFSIGIELEGADDVEYTERQYQCLADVTAAIQNHYPDIGIDNIVGHSDIAPGRKTDPGPSFDWSLYFSKITSD